MFKKFAYVFLNKLKKEISNLVKQKPKYEEFCPVFQLNAAFSDKTHKTLNHNHFEQFWGGAEFEYDFQ